MPPAAQHGHRHRHPKIQKVAHVEHQGVQDVTSIYEIVPPSTPLPDPAVLAMSCVTCSVHGLSLSLSPQSTIIAAHTASSLSTTTTTTATPIAQDAATASRYPRPSAPGFLYPQPIVPPHIYSHTMQHTNPHHGPGRLHRSLTHKDTYAIPTSLIAVLVFAVIAGAGLWAVIVMLIHWRGTTTGMSSGSQPGSKDSSSNTNTGWRPWIRRLNPRARTDARYEVLNSADEHELTDYAAGKTSAHDLHTPADDGTGGISLVNPFLVTPDQWLNVSMRRFRPRGSAEWAELHRAYFSSKAGTPTPGTPSRVPSSPHSLSYTELEDIEAEAREAQGRRASLALGGERARGRQERTSWVDLGLAAVDGAVDRLAGRIVRYADDGGKDEVLLLPLAEGKQD